MHRKQLVVNIKQYIGGWGYGSVGTIFPMQARKPEFRYPHKNPVNSGAYL